MGGGGAFLGGLVGFMLGGPIGGIVGAVFGNAVSEAEPGGRGSGSGAEQAFCPSCRSAIGVAGRGRWICPHCRSAFYYDGFEAISDDAFSRGSGRSRDFGSSGAVLDSERAQEVFFLTMFSLLALMAKADGVVSREEITLVDNFIKNDLKLSSEKRDAAIKIFNAAKNSGYSFEDMAEQFYSLFKNERNILLTMFDLLLRLAYSDGVFHANEERLIASARKIFHISDYEYESFRSRYAGDGTGEDGGRGDKGSSSSPGRPGAESLESCYAALGCKPSDSDEKIKEAYKKMAREYHPDTIISKGLPEDFVKFATQRFQQIQQAYEKIRKTRNF